MGPARRRQWASVCGYNGLARAVEVMGLGLGAWCTMRGCVYRAVGGREGGRERRRERGGGGGERKEKEGRRVGRREGQERWGKKIEGGKGRGREGTRRKGKRNSIGRGIRCMVQETDGDTHEGRVGVGCAL